MIFKPGNPLLKNGFNCFNTKKLLLENLTIKILTAGKKVTSHRAGARPVCHSSFYLKIDRMPCIFSIQYLGRLLVQHFI